MILRNSQYGMKMFWGQVLTVLAILPINDWSEIKAGP